MMHYITYSNDTNALLEEVLAAAPHLHNVDPESGERTIGPMIKVPTHRNGSETVSVVRDIPDELQGLTHLQILGTFYGSMPAGAPDENTQTWFSDKFYSSEYQTIYERVAGRPQVITDDNGFEREGPYILGVC